MERDQVQRTDEVERTQVGVTRLIDERGLTWFQVVVVLWCLVLAVIDSAALAMLSTMPLLMLRGWGASLSGLSSALSLFPLATAGGIVLGAPLLGWLGDGRGRRHAVAAATLVLGAGCMATAALSSGPVSLFWLLLAASIGAGGVIPNAVALATECAPRRSRTTLAVIVLTGMPLGIAIQPLLRGVSAGDPGAGLYTIGTIAIVAAVAAFAGLPESVKLMALHERRHPAVARLLERLNRGFRAPEHPRFVVEDEHQGPGFGPFHLFGGAGAVLTPLLWVLFALSQLGGFALISTLQAAARGASPNATGIGTILGMLPAGQIAGGIVLAHVMQLRHFLAIAVTATAGAVVAAVIGHGGLTSPAALTVAAFVAGFLIWGLQSGVLGVAASIYPTSLRASGTGSLFAFGRLATVMWTVLSIPLGAVIGVGVGPGTGLDTGVALLSFAAAAAIGCVLYLRMDGAPGSGAFAVATGLLADAGTFSLAAVFAKAAAVYRRSFARFIGLAVIASVPYYLAVAAFEIPAHNPTRNVLTLVGLKLFAFLTQLLATSAMMYGVVQELRGQPFSMAASLLAALRRLAPIIGITVCTGVAVFAGSMFLIVPGIILACALYVAIPACVAEHTDVLDSLSRSAVLTRGHRGEVFGVMLMYGVVLLVSGAVVAAAAVFTGYGGFIIARETVGVIVGSFYGVVASVLYYQLRAAREGVDLDKIAAVFV